MYYEDQIFLRYKSLSPCLNERSLRLFAASEALAAGTGGITLVHNVTGIARSTIHRGIKELQQQSNNIEPKSETLRIRRKGGDRKSIRTLYPHIKEALEMLVEPLSKGEPSSPMRWTLKSCRALAFELKEQGYNVSHGTIKKIAKRNDLYFTIKQKIASSKTTTP
jgi:hypothetical protein